MTREELVKAIADEFEEAIKDFDFEGFRDMRDCYMWDSADIREEVGAMVNALDCEWGVYDDGDVFCLERMEDIEYKVFIKEVYKLLKERNLY